jgi:hypothetical protein
MRLLVYMRDGRTVYLVIGRGNLNKLVGREPWHEDGGFEVARGIWNSLTGEYIWTRGVRLRFLAKGSIGVVEEGSPAEATRPVEETA